MFSDLFKKRIEGEEAEKKKAMDKLPRLIKIKLSNLKTKKMRKEEGKKQRKQNGLQITKQIGSKISLSILIIEQQLRSCAVNSII